MFDDETYVIKVVYIKFAAAIGNLFKVMVITRGEHRGEVRRPRRRLPFQLFNHDVWFHNPETRKKDY